MRETIEAIGEQFSLPISIGSCGALTNTPYIIKNYLPVGHYFYIWS
jgi:hypothetical protein